MSSKLGFTNADESCYSHWLQSGCNIITSVSLAVSLAEKLWSKITTLVGQNKPVIPGELTCAGVTNRWHVSVEWSTWTSWRVPQLQIENKQMTSYSVLKHVGCSWCCCIDYYGCTTCNNPNANSALSRHNFLIILGEKLAEEHIYVWGLYGIQQQSRNMQRRHWLLSDTSSLPLVNTQEHQLRAKSNDVNTVQIRSESQTTVFCMQKERLLRTFQVDVRSLYVTLTCFSATCFWASNGLLKIVSGRYAAAMTRLWSSSGEEQARWPKNLNRKDLTFSDTDKQPVMLQTVSLVVCLVCETREIYRRHLKDIETLCYGRGTLHPL